MSVAAGGVSIGAAACIGAAAERIGAAAASQSLHCILARRFAMQHEVMSVDDDTVDAVNGEKETRDCSETMVIHQILGFVDKIGVGDIFEDRLRVDALVAEILAASYRIGMLAASRVVEDFGKMLEAEECQVGGCVVDSVWLVVVAFGDNNVLAVVAAAAVGNTFVVAVAYNNTEKAVRVWIYSQHKLFEENGMTVLAKLYLCELQYFGKSCEWSV